MKITKTLCFCMALSSVASMQAVETETCEFTTLQDNTRVTNYQTNRPDVSKRLFVSKAVEQQIAHIKQLLANAKLAWMFENSLTYSFMSFMP